MRKTFRIFGLAIVATALCLNGCKKNEEEEEDESDPLAVEVSQTTSVNTILLEEFTGNLCGYCPEGHLRANEVKEAYGDKCLVINYHTASRLANAYCTSFGSTLNSNFNVEGGSFGLPAAMFNRTDLASTAPKLTLGRSNYMTAANNLSNKTACANVAAAATINKSTRELKVHVKVYYTSDGVGTSNKLNIAIIQNNVMGSQSGASTNPAQVVGSQYRHMEMFRDFVTGQWGEAISPVTQGSMIDKTYTYSIPEAYTDQTNNKTEPAVLEDLEVIVFVAEGNTNVVNACKAKITLQ